MQPINDNDQDQNTNNPANDNDDPEPSYAPDFERLDVLLALAGFDPERIEHEHRCDALHMAWCFQAGLADLHDVAKACRIPRSDVKTILAAMRIAARPGAIVA